LPASGKINLTNPGKPGLVGEGSTPSARRFKRPGLRIAVRGTG
jgi:hypothetical protein